MSGGKRFRWGATLVAMVTAGAALAGCAEDTGASSGGGGEGLEAGASKEEFQEAFADIDPIEIRTQSPAPKGSATGANVERYLEAVTEWSDGKITFEVAYANGAAEPIEADDALVDGRLDLAQVLPIYEPSEYPAMTALIETGFVSSQTAVLGTLQSNAWPNEVAFGNDKILEEFDAHGMVPLVPVYNSGSLGLFCSSERSDLASLKGATSSSSGSAQTAELSALGVEPTSIAYTELFESLQRGVVDCAVTAPTVGVLGGFLSEAPYGVIDPSAGFALAPGAMAFSKTTWETLPLVAQQLFWDRIDVFMASNIEEKIWPNNVEAVSIVKANGGGIVEFEDDARQALVDANEELLDAIRDTDAAGDGGAFVDGVLASATDWENRLADLGYADEVGYNEFDDWYAGADLDLASYTEAVMGEIFASRRPE